MNHQLVLQNLQNEIFAKFGADPARMASVQAFAAKMLAGSEQQFGLGTAAVHTDSPLTEMAVQYRNRDYIADAVMPVLPVNKKSDIYYQFKPDTMFNVAQTQITSAEAKPNRVAYGLDTTGSYNCVPQGLLDFIPAEEIANEDDVLDVETTSVDVLSNALMLAREIRVAGIVFNTSNYGSNTSALSGGNRWDTSTSDPVNDINLMLRTPLVRPNALIFGEDAWDYLRVHPKLIQYIISRPSAAGLGQTPLTANAEMVAAAFEVERVIIGRARYNTAREGATASYSKIWGKKCAAIRIEPKPNKRRTQTFGYTFRWNIAGAQMNVQKFIDPMPGLAGGTWIKETHADHEVVVGGSYVGYLYDTVVS